MKYTGNSTFSNQVQMFKSFRICPKNESKKLYQRKMNGEKIALVGLNTEIDEWLPELETVFKRIPLFRGKEQLWPHTKNWEFIPEQYHKNTPEQIELIQLIASGIYQFWKYWLRDRNYLESKLKLDLNPPVVEALSLSSSVTFVYVILVFGLFSATMSFFVEIIHVKIKHYRIRQINQIPFWYNQLFVMNRAYIVFVHLD